jgi:putative ABC transport system permease protein
MRILLQDLRYAIRLLLKSPGFAFVAVLTVALGIGANTAIFSVLDSVLLRELPVPNPQELSLLTDPDSHGSTFGGQGGERSLLAYSEFQYLRDHNEVFSHFLAADSQISDVNVSIGTASAAAQAHNMEPVRVHLVSGDYFDTLGVKPAAGQLFTPEIDRARGGAPVAVINYAFWKRRTRDIGIRMALGAEPGSLLWQVLGETLMLVGIGIAIGVPAALAGTRLVRSMLFGLGFTDPIVIVAAAALLAFVAALAGFLPARRASRVDPMVALRYE